MLTIWTFDGVENKHTIYRDKYCMKNICKSLIEHAKKIINFEKKNMILSINKQQESFKKAKSCYICNVYISMYTAVYLKCNISKEFQCKRTFNKIGENTEKY